MSTSELADLEALLTRVLPDPRGFVERIFGEVLERLATAPPENGPTVVGQAFPSAEPFGGSRPRDTTHGRQPPAGPAAHQALADRNMLLAAALGACDCWGENANCGACAGQGSAGWVPPDPELYAEYVSPAVRRTTGTDDAEDNTDKGENR